MAPLPRHIGARLSYPCAALLQELECPVRYAVLGNHDAMVNMAVVTDALETHGIPVLANQYVPIERDGRRIWLGGVMDVSVKLARVEEAVPKPAEKNGDPVILLAHEPDFADHVARYGGVDFMLSGHTHGGQVRLPLLPPMMLPPHGKKYVEGLFRVGPTQLYVNRGIGTVGLPMRLHCPPEITVFTLTPGPVV
jgi:predicted MPP superfamily phosphohydrolase